jgi:hypothetical protein
MPERIWAGDMALTDNGEPYIERYWAAHKPSFTHTRREDEFIRADIVAAKDAEIERLVAISGKREEMLDQRKERIAELEAENAKLRRDVGWWDNYRPTQKYAEENKQEQP